MGALVARCDHGHWQVDALGAPHIGERPEKELITGFVNRIAELSPQLVTFNASGFDLPVLRYRTGNGPCRSSSWPHGPSLRSRISLNSWYAIESELADEGSHLAIGITSTSLRCEKLRMA
jgi:predicted PolB exonuclease-like 3'-5' exonuclease